MNNHYIKEFLAKQANQTRVTEVSHITLAVIYFVKFRRIRVKVSRWASNFIRKDNALRFFRLFQMPHISFSAKKSRTDAYDANNSQIPHFVPCFRNKFIKQNFTAGLHFYHSHHILFLSSALLPLSSFDTSEALSPKSFCECELLRICLYTFFNELSIILRI